MGTRRMSSTMHVKGALVRPSSTASAKLVHNFVTTTVTTTYAILADKVLRAISARHVREDIMGIRPMELRASPAIVIRGVRSANTAILLRDSVSVEVVCLDETAANARLDM